MASTQGGYLLGMAPEEIARLAHQHETWRPQTDRVWDAARVGPGQTVIDLGSGPGFTTFDLAERVGPRGRVVAVDSSSTALTHLRTDAAARGVRHVDAVLGDVAELDLSRWRPDAVVARWLFWFLPQPEAIVARIAAALRPGGVFAIMDYANYMAIGTEPASDDFRLVFEAVRRSCRESGGSLDIAGQMPAMMARAGLDVTHVESLTQAGRPGSPIWQWVSAFQRLHVPALVDQGYITPDQLAALRLWWHALEQDPQSVFFAPPMLGVVGVKR
jgi:SAM-dependent methyltransferase